MDEQNTASEIEKQFPRIVSNLTLSWGRPEMAQYLDNLLFDERSDRHGFPEHVLSDILFLKMLHETLLHDHDRPDKHTLWGDPDYSKTVGHGGSD